MTAALAITFGATLAALLFEGWLVQRWDLGEGFTVVWLHASLLLGAGLLGVLTLGRGTWKASLGERPTGRWMLAAPVVGALVFAFAMLYVEGMARLAGQEVDVSSKEATTAMLVLVILVAPIAEEWVDRGVAWTACLRASGPATALVATSALFALSHGLNGGGYLEFPHRFLGGLALGWLRWRSGSLAPPILAHMTWNVLAVV